MSRDLRREPRIDFQLPVTIKGYDGETKIRDFSMSGLFIEMDDPGQFSRGDHIILVLELPFANKPMVVQARIMRLNDEGIGVEFLELYPEDRIELEQCFHLFKHTVPMPETD